MLPMCIWFRAIPWYNPNWLFWVWTTSSALWEAIRFWTQQIATDYLCLQAATVIPALHAKRRMFDTSHTICIIFWCPFLMALGSFTLIVYNGLIHPARTMFPFSGEYVKMFARLAYLTERLLGCSTYTLGRESGVFIFAESIPKVLDWYLLALFLECWEPRDFYWIAGERSVKWFRIGAWSRWSSLGTHIYSHRISAKGLRFRIAHRSPRIEAD